MSRFQSFASAMRASRIAALLFVGLFMQTTAFATAPLVRVDAGGGTLSTPVVQGDYLYFGTGSTVSTWNIHDRLRPIESARTLPTRGPVRSLTIANGYLFALWNTPWSTGGIDVYSLADPAHPALSVSVNSYAGPTQRPIGMVATGNHLYIGDADNGLVLMDIADPLNPLTMQVSADFYENDTMAMYGNTLVTSGLNFIGDHLIRIIDADPDGVPFELGWTSIEGFLALRVVLTEGYAIGVGDELIVQDIHDPQNITRVFEAPIEQATQAIRDGDALYLFGASGVQVWNFANPAAPALVRTIAMDTFGAEQAIASPAGPIVLTRTDRGLLLDATDPLNPSFVSSFTLPFGVEANAAHIDASHVYVAQAAYGLGVFDDTTLASIGRYDTDLPQVMSARDMEDIAVDDTGRAYLAAWGYGVLIVDLANPSQPTLLGRFAFPYASSIEAHAGRVYVGSTTNGGMFKILDASNPALPAELFSMATDATVDITVRGMYAYLADSSGGLRIVDVSTPSQAHQVGQYTGCNASGVDISGDTNKAYLACDDGITILDISNKAAPVLLGSLSLPGNAQFPGYNVAWSIIVDGATAYVGTEYGVDVIDVHHPATPVRRYHNDTGFYVRKLAQAPQPDGRIFAFAAQAGTYVYRPDGIFENGFDD